MNTLIISLSAITIYSLISFQSPVHMTKKNFFGLVAWAISAIMSAQIYHILFNHGNGGLINLLATLAFTIPVCASGGNVSKASRSVIDIFYKLKRLLK